MRIRAAHATLTAWTDGLAGAGPPQGDVWVWLLGGLVAVLLGGAAVVLMRSGPPHVDLEAALRHADGRGLLTDSRDLLLRSVAEHLAEGLLIADMDHRVIYVNSRLIELTGYDRDELLGRSASDLIRPVPPGEEELASRALGEPSDLNRDSFETTLRRKDGKTLWVQVHASPLLDPAGDVIGTLAALSDISGRKEAERQLERMALYDTLTGLANRNLFFDRLDHALERSARTGRSVAVLYMDLDRFKVVNDTLGHAAGDELLAAVASRVRSCFRDEDTVARLGGDEFAGVLEDVKAAEEARAAAERLVQGLEPPFEIMGTEVHCSASIGIALGSPKLESGEDLHRFSDIAMYKAKESDGTSYHIFDPGDDSDESQRLHRENELRAALTEGHFFLEYQPMVELSSGRVVGVEALIRWDHPERGRTLPDEFLPLAEEAGLIVPIGEWVLRESTRRVAEWTQALEKNGRVEEADGFELCVNVSARQFRDKELIEVVAESLSASGLSAGALKLEITEGMVVNSRNVIGRLRKLGVGMSVDHFGTGFSSLAQIKHLPVGTVKVDRTFVSGLGEDPRDTAILRALFLVADEIGIAVIAEGIETKEQVRRLRELGCECGQGFALSRPVSPAAIRELLVEDRRLGWS